MIHLTSIKDIEKAIADNRLCLFYIKAPDCGVCNVMLDKVERLADSITAVYSFYADITEEPLIAGQFLVYPIASRCEKRFPAFLVMGLGILLTSQAIFNMMVAVGLVPVTGQPLPLVSKGGTSTIINCAYIGVILSVCRSSNKIRFNNELGGRN